MTKTSKEKLPRGRGRPRKCNIKSLTTKKDSYNAVESKEEYKHILGFKKPIIVLQKQSIPPEINKNYRDLRFKSSEMSKKNKSNCLTKDVSKIQEFNEDDLSLHNTALELAELLENETVESRSGKNNNNTKKLNRRRKNDSNLSRRKRRASVMNPINFKPDVWEIKHDATMKAEALINSKKLRVCLEEINYHKNSNIIDSKTERFSKDSDTISNIGIWEWNESITNDNTQVEQKYDTYENVEAHNSETGNNEHTDFIMTSYCSKNSLETITLANNMVSNGATHTQTSDAVNNHVKNEDTLLTVNKKQDLTLRNQVKDCEDKTVQETKKLPMVIETAVVPKNAIEISIKNEVSKTDENESTTFCSENVLQEGTICTEFSVSHINLPEISLYKYQSTNEQSNITKANILHVTNKNLLEECNEKNATNTTIGTKNFAESIYHTHTKTNNKKHTVENTICKDNVLPNQSNALCNVNTIPPPQSIPFENVKSSTDVNTIKCSNKISVLNTDMLSSVNCSRAEQKQNSIVTKQKIVSIETETVKIRNAAQPLHENINLSTRKRANNETITDNAKKVKLNRNRWSQSVNGKNNAQTDPCGTSNIIELNADKIIPETSITTVIKSDNDTHNKGNENEDVEIVEAKDEEATSNLVKQKQIEFLNENTNKEDCDSLQNTRKSEETTSKMQKSFVTDDENEDFDCMSLYPDADLLKEFDDLVIPVQQNSCNSKHFSEKTYEMTDNVFSNYYQSTAYEFNKIYDTSNANIHKNNSSVENKKKPLALRLGKPIEKKTNPLSVKERIACRPAQKQDSTEVLGESLANIFRGYCYNMLRTSKCQRQKCPFRHDFVVRILWFYKYSEQRLFELIDELVSQNFVGFVRTIYARLLFIRADVCCILKILKKLYELNLATDKMALDSIASFENRNISIQTFLLLLPVIVSNNDTKFVNWILKLIANRINHYVDKGEYWNRLKQLLIKIEYLDSAIVENILRECLLTGRNSQDIHEIVLKKVNLNCVNQKLLSCFESLFKYTVNKNQVREEITPTESVRSIKNTSNAIPVTKVIISARSNRSIKNTSNENHVFKEVTPTESVTSINNNTSDKIPVTKVITSTGSVRSIKNTSNENHVPKEITPIESVTSIKNTLDKIQVTKVITSTGSVRSIKNTSNENHVPKDITPIESVTSIKNTLDKIQITKVITSTGSVRSIKNTSNENHVPKEITPIEPIPSIKNTLDKIQITKACTLTGSVTSINNTSNENDVPKEIESPDYVRSINSPALDNEVFQTDVSLPTIKTSQTITPKVWVDTSSKTRETDNNNNNNNNAQNINHTFTLYPIDDLPKPYSAIARDKFWKFYLDVHSLQQGLKYKDYDHVMKILNSAEQDQKTVFSRACVQILQNEIKSSQYHLSELASLAVRIGARAIAYEILLDVMICILAHLAEKELWVLAFRLLRDTDIILKYRNCFTQLDAATILLFVEVYLANRQAIKSFILLKHTNIIYTDRNKWKPQNNAKDDYVRARIIALLLDTFCGLSPEHAFFLFQFLIVNQSSNFYPVDLVRPANKLISILLLKRDEEMILETATLINKYDITLEPITYRALVTVLVNVDIALAKQFYQKGIVLGIYSDVQFYPVTYNIVNSDWTREEMYLTILNIMQQLSSNIGHAIDRANARQLSVHILFTSIPSGKQLARNEGTNQEYVEKFRKAKALMTRMLRTEFNPPIILQKATKKDTLCKLNGKSVHQYLLREYYK